MTLPAARIGGEAGLAVAINGSPQFLGVITATSVSKDNTNTAVPFKNTGECLKGMLLLIQADSACYVQPQTVAATAVVASDSSGGGIYLAARERIPFALLPTEGYLSLVAVSGTTNLKVWRLQ